MSLDDILSPLPTANAPVRAAPAKLTIVTKDWKPFHRNTLRGFCTVVIEEVRLNIHDVTIHVRGDSRWAGLPGRPLLDRDGNPLRDPAGKVRYDRVLSWHSKAVSDAFSERVIASLLAQHPRALDPA